MYRQRAVNTATLDIFSEEKLQSYGSNLGLLGIEASTQPQAGGSHGTINNVVASHPVAPGSILRAFQENSKKFS